MVQLHRGRHAEAVAILADPPDLFRCWSNGVSRHLYGAAWAEAAVLAGGAEAAPGREAFAAMGATPSAPAAAFG